MKASNFDTFIHITELYTSNNIAYKHILNSLDKLTLIHFVIFLHVNFTFLFIGIDKNNELILIN